MNCFLTKQTHHWKEELSQDLRILAGKFTTCRRRTHLAGFVRLGVEDAVTEPQAGLLADLLKVRPHGVWKETLTRHHGHYRNILTTPLLLILKENSTVFYNATNRLL